MLNEQNWLIRYTGNVSNKIFLSCKRGTGGYRRRHGPPYCNLRALFIKENNKLYVINQHNHRMEADQEGEFKFKVNKLRK